MQDKLTAWYSSSSTYFPDDTKMRLVPTITSVTSMNNRVEFASCLARQEALNARLASAVTREISMNLLLDRRDPSTKKSFRQVIMEITLEKKPGTTLLFHTIDSSEFRIPSRPRLRSQQFDCRSCSFLEGQWSCIPSQDVNTRSHSMASQIQMELGKNGSSFGNQC